jgi:hypothetical protein
VCAICSGQVGLPVRNLYASVSAPTPAVATALHNCTLMFVLRAHIHTSPLPVQEDTGLPPRSQQLLLFDYLLMLVHPSLYTLSASTGSRESKLGKGKGYLRGASHCWRARLGALARVGEQGRCWRTAPSLVATTL